MVWDDRLSVKEVTEEKKKTPRFPSRERNFAVRRKGARKTTTRENGFSVSDLPPVMPPPPPPMPLPAPWASLCFRDKDEILRDDTLNERLQRRHTTPALPPSSPSSSLRMSPKGRSGGHEMPKVEVRVSCVAGPGGEPQGVRVRIPEPKKRPISPPSTRTRCPSVPEKDFYRKTASLDRRERYPTLSGAEIKQYASVSTDLPRAATASAKRNPMLDRRNRYPTISGAELRRSMTIGRCPLEDGLDLSLAPWPGMKWACVRVLHLYCKVFDQYELFELIVRKNCTSCKCPKEVHDVCHEEWVSVRARLGLKSEGSNNYIGFEPRDRGLAWAPPGLPPHKVEEYFSMLPEISVPRLGTPGERHRDRQLATQLPKQDLARTYCRHLDPRHAASADDFMAARNEIALDIGSVQEVLERGHECGVCHEPFKYGSLAVMASKLGLLYHPSCFQCAQCHELLVDLAYCVHDDALYCERHYAERLKPRCAACDENNYLFN
ncbi:Similar to esn: Protein espinas (Drosophila melanogaster) [Cotesia congregata]|uniref:Similar to esn: Protein espinas (Drosophila melanogaster) n=1 Tax=Cotesia congregata TaxID=51543 RepID=A0A8J2HT03_COTCN|nr:Similar to esn: Protein espinas (Drosophila melanogaster) [Cotesia congregata]